MDANAIVSAISTVGFPVVACCGLFWFANKLVDKITSVIEENTVAINTLIAKMESEDAMDQ